MKPTTRCTFALVLMLGTAQASAIPQETGIESPEEAMPAEPFFDGQSEDFLPEEAPGDAATAGDSTTVDPDASDDDGWMEGKDGTSQVTGDAAHEPAMEPAVEEKLSDGQRFRRSLKRMLLGVLMPAVEREVREAVDPDQAQSETDSGLQSEP